MLITILLTITFICAMLLMIFAATAFIQDKKGFSSAPKAIQEVLIKSNFFQHYYPETKAVKDKLKYGFNIKSQVIKLIVFPIASAVAAWLCVAVF